jgi:hypothetical protein
MGSNTRTLHIVTELLDIPMIQQDMVNATAYSATSETICSYCKQKNHTIEICVNKKFDRRLKDKVARTNTCGELRDLEQPSSAERQTLK